MNNATNESAPTGKPSGYTVPKGLRRVRGIDEAIGEIERELGVRFRCFADWQANGKLDRITASERWERLRAALAYLDHFSKMIAKQGEDTVWDPNQDALVDVPREPSDS